MTEDAPGGGNVAEFSVSEISNALKRVVEDAFGRVRVRGEISGYRGPHSSGHAYFRLKDDRSAIEAVIWRGTMAKLAHRPEEGLEVVATGKLTTYPGSSKYQIVIEDMEPAGAGALMALLEERRRRLAAEGLFDESRKQLLPYLPRHIGVVTSPTGAVIRDILHRVMDRFPLRVTVWPVRVQGDTTPAEVAAAVAGFNAMPAPDRPDVLIVARGGGSLEDLWGFNDEVVVRAVAASLIPVISAVGHETDWTLIDHAADMRAPTPTGAAEMAVPVKADLEATVSSLGARLDGAMRRAADRRRQALSGAARALPSADSLLATARQRFDVAAGGLLRNLDQAVQRRRQRFAGLRLSGASLSRAVSERSTKVAGLGHQLDRALPRLNALAAERHRRLAARLRIEPIRRQIGDATVITARLGARSGTAINRIMAERRTKLAAVARVMATLSHDSVLARGFALVKDKAGHLVTSAEAARAAAQVTLVFAGNDRADAIVTGGAARQQAARKAGLDRSEQQNLFANTDDA